MLEIANNIEYSPEDLSNPFADIMTNQGKLKVFGSEAILIFFPKKTKNSSDYDKEDYFLPYAALKRVFKEQIENGTLPDNCEIQQFRSIFPCPQDSVKFDLEKQIDTARVKQTAAEEQKN